jgi:hypothetical protein
MNVGNVLWRFRQSGRQFVLFGFKRGQSVGESGASRLAR